MSLDSYSPVTEEKRSVPTGPIVWGVILIVVGVGWLLSTLGVTTLPWRVVLAGILVVVGIAMIAISTSDASPSGLFAAGSVIAVVLALLSTANAAFALPLAGGVGERNLAPTLATLESEYQLMAGELDVSLADVVFPEGETHLELGITFGSVRVRDIPGDVAVSVEGAVWAGELRLLDSRFDGLSVSHVQTDPDFDESPKRLTIKVTVGFGEAVVQR